MESADIQPSRPEPPEDAVSPVLWSSPSESYPIPARLVSSRLVSLPSPRTLLAPLGLWWQGHGSECDAISPRGASAPPRGSAHRQAPAARDGLRRLHPGDARRVLPRPRCPVTLGSCPCSLPWVFCLLGSPRKKTRCDGNPGRHTLSPAPRTLNLMAMARDGDGDAVEVPALWRLRSDPTVLRFGRGGEGART